MDPKLIMDVFWVYYAKKQSSVISQKPGKLAPWQIVIMADLPARERESFPAEEIRDLCVNKQWKCIVHLPIQLCAHDRLDNGPLN